MGFAGSFGAEGLDRIFWAPAGRVRVGSWRFAGCESNVIETQSDFGDNGGMDKGHVIEMLRVHRDELRAAGVVHLSVFGSVARGEASERSDVDLMADFDKS